MNLNFAQRLLMLAMPLFLSACGTVGKQSGGFSLYDLGPARPVSPPLVAVPAGIEVRAPSWLSSSAMQYRITDRQPEQREAFLESRWAAQPAELLALALDRALIGDVVSSSACRLQIDLDEFVQVFDSPASSRSRVVVRAELLAARSDAPLARRIFMIEHPSETADAAGGVMAHRAGVQQLSTEMADWLRKLDQNEGQGLNKNGRCRK